MVMRQRGRRRVVEGVTVVTLATVAVLLGANLLAHYAYLPLPWHGQPAIQDAASLPDSLWTCGRAWSKDHLARTITFAQATAQAGGADPAVADPGTLTACPANACSALAGSPCDTVIFVRIGDDAYIAYALQGGP